MNVLFSLPERLKFMSVGKLKGPEDQLFRA
jgi:hypothetical protein